MEKEIVLTKLERQLLMYDIFSQCTVIEFVEITNLLPINKRMIERDVKDLTDAPCQVGDPDAGAGQQLVGRL